MPTTGTIKNALRYLNNRYSLPESISQQISLTLPWKIAVGDNGRLLAVLQENVIEIRKAKDESIVGKASGIIIYAIRSINEIYKELNNI